MSFVASISTFDPEAAVIIECSQCFGLYAHGYFESTSCAEAVEFMSTHICDFEEVRALEEEDDDFDDGGCAPSGDYYQEIIDWDSPVACSLSK